MAVRNAKCPECGTVVQSSWKFCPSCATPVAKAFESTKSEVGVIEGAKHKINWAVVLSIAGVFVVAALGFIFWVSKEPERLEQERQAQLAIDSAKLREEVIDVFGSMTAFNNFREVEAAKLQVVADIRQWSVEGRFYRIDGSVVNNSNRKITYWQVIFEVLSDDGSVVNSGWKDSLVPIDPGGRTRWFVSLPGVVESGTRVTERMGEIRFEN